VELSTSKTKLLFFNSSESDYSKYVKLLSTILIGETTIPFTDSAEHVGITRSVNGNLPHKHQRMVSHKRALNAIMFTGMSRRHRANPLACIRAERIFASPVLFSGLLSTAGHAYDTNKMIVELRMLSGRYRVGSLLRHFSSSISGICELCGLELEDIEHILLPRCPTLQERRRLLLDYFTSVLAQSPICSSIFKCIEERGNSHWVQFVLDCSVIPDVISAAQKDDSVYPLLFKATRTWCYSLHRTRLKLLGRWC
jgi:hypothetical protein